VIDLNNEQEMFKAEIDRRNTISNLLTKQMAGKLTIEESNELTHHSIVLATESMETVRELREKIAQLEEETSFLGTAAVVYQDFIASMDMNEEFGEFFETALSVMVEDEQEEAFEEEKTDKNDGVH
jgi:hypothetical protein